MKIIHSFLLVAIAGSNVFAQSKKLWIDEGDKFFRKHDYSTAIALYSKALDDTSVVKNTSVLPYNVSLVSQKFKSETAVKPGNDSERNTELKPDKKYSLKSVSPEKHALLQLAHAHRLNSDFPKAIEGYQKCIEKEIPDAEYYYALSLMNVRNYRQALAEFDRFLSSGKGNDSLLLWAQKKETACYFALDSLKTIRTVKVNKLDTIINCGNASFGACYFDDSSRLLITSARNENASKNTLSNDAGYLCDIYAVNLGENGAVSAENLGRTINSNMHDGAAFVSEKAIYFTRWDDRKPGEASIWRAFKKGKEFYEPQKLHNGINQKGFKSTHPFVSADGRKFFFSSNKPGGIGGMDIWMCDIDEEGNISEARILPAQINTLGDEVTPFLHEPTATFYFSSNGHTGMGGLDVFRAEYKGSENVFGTPVNMNEPVNSSKDDSYFIMDKSGVSGYFSSDREDCPGGNCYKLYGYKIGNLSFDVGGVVRDSLSGEPIPFALITIVNVHDDSEVYSFRADENGEYFQTLKANAEYFIKAQQNKFLARAATQSSKDKIESAHFSQDFLLSKVPAGEIEILGIEYDFNSAALRPVSLERLDKIASLLSVNNNLIVSLEANTDSRGNDEYNLKLSQARAQACVDYLILKGISAERITAKGNGKSNPIVPDNVISKMKVKSEEWEAAHQRNRRTAFRIVGESEFKIVHTGK